MENIKSCGVEPSVTVLGHFINGKLVTKGDPTSNVFNPAAGSVTKKLELARKETVCDALLSASKAFPEWRDTSPIKRARIMFKFKGLLEKNATEICRLIGEEHGKICHDARGELQRGIENVEYACCAPEILKGEFNKNAAVNIDCWSEFHPLGVVAGITPFNFPAMIPLWMYPLAIVCGNCFILKPSERDPSSAMFIAQLLTDAGLPEGVLNVINGDKETVTLLLEDERVESVSFVGSTNTASAIYTKATSVGKRCQALGGAKNHAVIMQDADLNNVVSQLMGAAFGSAGERCMAISVAVVVGDDFADVLVSKIKDAIKGLKVGSFDNEENDFGPLITMEHRKKVINYIDSAEKEGATIIADGRVFKNPKDYERGFFLGATLIDNVTETMNSYQEEIFGPVLQIVRVSRLTDAINLINKHQYGNGACIFTNDGDTARQFSDCIKVGMVGINVPLPVPISYQSFGGWKRSLFGDLYAYGPDGVRFYTRRKTITQRWHHRNLEYKKQFSMPSSK